MKQTELDRKERDLRKERKRLQKESQRRKDSDSPEAEATLTIKSAYDKLVSLFEYDEEEIYNIHKNNEHLVEVLIEMQESFAKTEVESTLRKAIRRTRIKQKEQAFKDVCAILEI